MVARTLCAVHVIVTCLMVCIVSAADDNAVVKKSIAKVMQSPYGDASPVGLAKKGDRFKIRYPQGEWYCIDYNGSVGWIYSANIAVEHGPSAPPAVEPPPRAIENPPPAVTSKQGTAHISADSGAVQKKNVPPPVQIEKIEKKEPAFSVPEVRPKKTFRNRPSAGNSIIVKAEPVDKMVSEMVASADSLKRSVRANAATHADSVSSSREPLPAPAQKYFEILESPTKILKDLSPQSPILGLAKKNDVYPLVYAGASWCKIIVKHDTGWAESSRGRVIDSLPVLTERIPAIVVISVLAAVAALVLVFVIIFVVISLRRQKFKKSSLRRDVLIISHSAKEINYSLTDTATTLPKCFSEIGFKVNLANGLDHARTLLVHYAPDVIVIDWQLEKTIQKTIQDIVSDKETSSSILIIFYNVPDPTEISKRNTAPNMFFLGLVFSDRDIFKIVTPLIMARKSTHTVKKSVQTSALEGDIRLGNLLEVMQFIEIGRKTGCLYITIGSPFGLIYFEQGRITYAASKTALGKDAIFEILNLKEGHFHLILDKVSQTKNVNLSTLEVLMDWTKVKDEAFRG